MHDFFCTLHLYLHPRVTSRVAMNSKDAGLHKLLNIGTDTTLNHTIALYSLEDTLVVWDTRAPVRKTACEKRLNPMAVGCTTTSNAILPAAENARPMTCESDRP